MGDNLPALLLDNNNTNVSLAPSFLAKLQTREDYESAFSVVAETANTSFWWQADLILSYYQKFHSENLDIYRSGQLMNSSTVKYFMRTAAAFPPEMRVAQASFNHHYAASFADSFNSQTMVFVGEKRFEYIKKVVDEGLSTRHLQNLIQSDRKKIELGLNVLPCEWCKLDKHNNEIHTYALYRSGPKDQDHPPVKFQLHDYCLNPILELIKYANR